MGVPYGSIPRKTVPRAEEEKAMDFSVLWDFEVWLLTYECTFDLWLQNRERCSLVNLSFN